MQLRYTEYDDFLAFNKPFGVRTHKVNEGQFGFVEYLSEKMSQPLWVVHRLDKETSGLILFAKSKETAAALGTLFESHQIKKTYYFLTDQSVNETRFVINTHIEKQDEFYVNNPNLPANSETELDFVKKIGNHFLWKAGPKTGKPHQIRLHAQKAGIPILGDDQHGGSIYYRLALHAQKIEFTLNSKKFVIENTLPEMNFLFDDCYYGRHQLFQIPPQECYRLIHTESSIVRADVFGDRLWVYDYSEKGLSEAEKNQIRSFASDKNLIFILRHMLDRGQGVGGLENQTLDVENTQNWQASEESVQYFLKTDSGFSPGLFLDQRENRLWVKSHSKNKKVMNLFSYTSGFSVNAALGGASTVTTVDVSKKFLEWSKENFQVNGLDPAKYEFFSQDTLLFLKGSIKRERKWDLIICDPPSFGRSKDSVWKIERDLPELAELLLGCLNKKGQLLFTCNFEKRTRDEVIKLFCKKLNKSQFKISLMPMQSLDYELTDDYKNLMKGFILTHN
ncbi:MAG: class I SAM-dependent methyltransferase [Pseudobdellovibrio sp.]